jgi:hypothetical protein
MQLILDRMYLEMLYFFCIQPVFYLDYRKLLNFLIIIILDGHS